MSFRKKLYNDYILRRNYKNFELLLLQIKVLNNNNLISLETRKFATILLQSLIPNYFFNYCLTSRSWNKLRIGTPTHCAEAESHSARAEHPEGQKPSESAERPRMGVHSGSLEAVSIREKRAQPLAQTRARIEICNNISFLLKIFNEILNEQISYAKNIFKEIQINLQTQRVSFKQDAKSNDVSMHSEGSLSTLSAHIEEQTQSEIIKMLQEYQNYLRETYLNDEIQEQDTERPSFRHKVSTRRALTHPKEEPGNGQIKKTTSRFVRTELRSDLKSASRTRHEVPMAPEGDLLESKIYKKFRKCETIISEIFFIFYLLYPSSWNAISLGGIKNPPGPLRGEVEAITQCVEAQSVKRSAKWAHPPLGALGGQRPSVGGTDFGDLQKILNKKKEIETLYENLFQDFLQTVLHNHKAIASRISFKEILKKIHNEYQKQINVNSIIDNLLNKYEKEIDKNLQILNSIILKLSKSEIHGLSKSETHVSVGGLIPYLTKQRNYCLITGRSRGIIKRFGISRLAFRKLADQGKIPGIRKASW